MPKVCKNCFIDSELVAFITSQSLLGDCNFCSSKNIECVESDELNAFFTELLSHFKHDPNGLGINKKIQSNLSLFSSFNTATALLNDILAKIKTPFASANELVEFSDVILDNVNYWDSLKKKLVEESRYLTDINYLTYDLGWDGFFATQIEVPKGMELFRARLHSNSGEPPFKLTDMSCPPKNLIKSGRANPTGIPCLYLSDNYLTTLYEVRAGLLDEVSIGKFVVKKSITHPVLISDFTESGSIFHPSRVEQKIKSTLLKKKISADLSKPMRRYDSELEYVPTQFICEFIKVYTGVHGIKFKSSLHAPGNNFVIFDKEIMECIEVNQVKIKSVDIAV